MSDGREQLIDEVARAARRRLRCDEEYREALEAAVAAGVTYAELARALGLTRQGVRQYLTVERRRR